jgi:4-amino-4-deoxy-L-arabinose transferase-like glycosyltransferase
MTWNKQSISVCIFLSSLLLFVPFLGGSHLFDWDEVNFAEAAREMLVTGEYSYVQINFKLFWEKPPMFIWMQAISMSVFGVSEFAARLPNAICGALTLLLLFRIGSSLHSNRFGLLWILVYAGSILPQFYFRSGIIDPWFNLFIFLGIHQLILGTEEQSINRTRLAISALFIGLAVLTKGPTAFGLVGICCAIYFAVNFKNHNWRFADPVIYLLTVLVVGFSWFLFELLRGHGYVLQEFIDYHIRLLSQSEAGHGQPFYYHPLVLLIGCFPMSLFFLFGLKKSTDPNARIDHYRKWMSILFWVVLIVFSIVKTKIVHYSSLTYLPMSFLAALFIDKLIHGEQMLKNWQSVLLGMFAVLLGSAFFLVGIFNKVKEPLLTLMKENTLPHGNFSQYVPDGPLDWSIGVFFLISSLAAIYCLWQNKTRLGIGLLFGTTLITVTFLSTVIAPKIDRYTQTGLFEFYKEKGSEAYLQPLAFHSYAHLFYGKREPIPVETDDEPYWMIFEEVDRPVYFISRVQDLEANLKYFPHLKEVTRKGGYIILVRTDKNYPFLEAP